MRAEHERQEKLRQQAEIERRQHVVPTHLGWCYRIESNSFFKEEDFEHLNDSKVNPNMTNEELITYFVEKQALSEPNNSNSQSLTNQEQLKSIKGNTENEFFTLPSSDISKALSKAKESPTKQHEPLEAPVNEQRKTSA